MAHHSNPQNLRPPFTPDEAREIGARGGKASAKSKKKKKTMKDLLEYALHTENSDPGVADENVALGFEPEDNERMVKILAALIQEGQNGNVKATELLSKLMYGDSKNVSLDVKGEVKTESRVKIYLPKIDDPEPDEEEDDNGNE
jgi:hypothetical protein